MEEAEFKVHGKSLFSRIGNRVFHLLARFLPGSKTTRPFFHRLRGVKIGKDVFIGDDVYLDNEFPEAIEIGDNVQMSIRTIVVAHTRGAGRVIIGKDAFIGPNSVLVCGAGRTLRIGEGAVVGAGSIITKSVPPRIYVAPPPVEALAKVTVPIPLANSMEHFWSGLVLLEKKKS